MDTNPKKLKQKTHKETEKEKEQFDRDLKEFTVLLYDIYQDKKRKEKQDEVSS